MNSDVPIAPRRAVDPQNFRDAAIMAVKVTIEDVARVAELAHLRLTAHETGSMVHDLNAILDYVAQLNELDTSAVIPLAQAGELEEIRGSSSLRNDEIKPSLDRAEVTSQAPESDQAFFKVPKVIER